MTIVYFDSSLILSALFEERDDLDYDALWQREHRLSSNLLVIEGIIGIRRAGADQKLTAADLWIQQRLSAFDQVLRGINLKTIDRDIEQAIRNDPRYAGCRALDAIHLATAVFFQEHLKQEIEICTLDRRMRAVANKLGFALLPQ